MKKNNFLKYACYALIMMGTLSACSSSDDDVVVPDIPPSDGTVMTLEGGPGDNAAENGVFVDFSTESQSPVKRDSWDLALYSGSQFRAKLNNMTGAAAIGTDETDFSAINSANFDITTLAVGQGRGTMDMVDAPDGSLEGTAIAEISTNDNDNKIYVINTKGGTNVSADAVYKVRVLRKGTDGYTVQYAQLDATSFESIDVTKDADYNFQYVSFTTKKVVSVEPKKTDWDVVWGYHMYYTSFNGNTIPYGFADLILINHLAGVSAVEVLTENVSYEDFAESNLNGITFSTDVDVIGANWRSTSSGIKKDRFYVVKDAAGNIYKLKFNSMGLGDDAGKRGYPEIEFKLVKRG